MAIVGPGGVGGLLGALLTRLGEDVTFVAPERTASVLNAEGLRVESGLYGNFAVAAKAVSTLTAPVDVCVVAVKAMQLEAAMERMPKDVLGEAVVVPFLNGVDLIRCRRRCSRRCSMMRPRGTSSNWMRSGGPSCGPATGPGSRRR